MGGDRACPSCGTAVSADYRICPRCGTTVADPDWDALDALRERIVGIDAQLSELVSRRQSLVDDYERHRVAITGRTREPAPLTPVPMSAAETPVEPHPERPEWSGARVRALLLGLGAALLGISALTFTAVAWSRLGDAGRAVLLLAATALITALAVALRRRLPMTAEAFAGLAIALALIDVFAGRRAGVAHEMSWQMWWAMGVLAVAGFAAALGLVVGGRISRFAVAALLPLAPQLAADRVEAPHDYWLVVLMLAALAAVVVEARVRWARDLFPESRMVLGAHAGVSWLWATFLGVAAASYPETFAGAAPAALAVASLAVAPELVRRRLPDGFRRTAVSALVAAVPSGVVLTFADTVVGLDGLGTTAVIAGAATIVVASFLSAFRVGGSIAGSVFAAPGTAAALAAAAPAVLGPPAWLAEPWGGSVHAVAREVYLGTLTSPALTGSWLSVVILVTVAVVAVVLGLRIPILLGMASVATVLAVELSVLTADVTVLAVLVVTTALLAVMLLGGALAERRRPGGGWALLPGAVVAAVPTAGWAAVSPGASVGVLAVTATAAAGAAVIVGAPTARARYGALAALLGVSFVGVAVRAAGAGTPAAGFAVAVAAGAILLLGASMLRGAPPVGSAIEAVGAISAGIGVVLAAPATPWLAGALTVLVPVALLAAREPARRIYYAGAAAVLALGALTAWLAAAEMPRGIQGFALAVAAGAVVGAGMYGLRTDRVTGVVLERIGDAGAVVGVVIAANSSPWLAAALTVLVPVAVFVAREPSRRVYYASAAALLGLGSVWVWLTAAHVRTLAVYGFALAVAAGAVVLIGLFVLRTDKATGVALEWIGDLAAVLGIAAAASSRTWLAGTLTALVVFSALAALRVDRRLLYGAASGICALGAVWAWLSAAHVGVVEAYTAPAAAVAFLGGLARWRRGPGGSWLAFGPGLVLAIGPTLVLGMADDDLGRLIIAAALSLAVVVAGAVWRLQAPLCLGAVALAMLAIDQWGDDIVRMPRWISLGTVGLLLMWIGATFEHRRRDWRRASDLIGHLG